MEEEAKVASPVVSLRGGFREGSGRKRKSSDGQTHQVSCKLAADTWRMVEEISKLTGIKTAFIEDAIRAEYEAHQRAVKRGMNDECLKMDENYKNEACLAEIAAEKRAIARMGMLKDKP